MSSDTCQPVPDSSSSSLKAMLLRSDAILQLGKRIVKALESDPPADMLGLWMAHYVAELMSAAVNAVDEDRPIKLRQCADVIFAFWTHRNRLPNGIRPFEEFESLFRALENLDPDSTAPGYYIAELL